MLGAGGGHISVGTLLLLVVFNYVFCMGGMYICEELYYVPSVAQVRICNWLIPGMSGCREASGNGFCRELDQVERMGSCGWGEGLGIHALCGV